MAKDPVCDMEVNESTAEHKIEYAGKTYYFCCPSCKRTFEQDPQKYANKASGGGGCSCCG
jgi:YHS domain-containing protein